MWQCLVELDPGALRETCDTWRILSIPTRGRIRRDQLDQKTQCPGSKDGTLQVGSSTIGTDQKEPAVQSRHRVFYCDIGANDVSAKLELGTRCKALQHLGRQIGKRLVQPRFCGFSCLRSEERVLSALLFQAPREEAARDKGTNYGQGEHRRHERNTALLTDDRHVAHSAVRARGNHGANEFRNVIWVISSSSTGELVPVPTASLAPRIVVRMLLMRARSRVGAPVPSRYSS